jgi:glycerol-3-phosphate acyltransferase PlsY
MLIAAPILIAYLLGAVPFGLLVARTFGVKDIRREGSGNIGATNVWRVAGWKAAILAYLLDIGKGAGAILIAGTFAAGAIDHDLLLVLAAVAVALGSIFPVYLRFRGGKGVSASLGAVVIMLPLETLICLGVFLVVVLLTRYISLASMTAALGLVLVLLVEILALDRPVAAVYLYFSVGLALVIIWAHRHNIGRLTAGKESRFSLSSPPRRGESHV